MKLNTLRYKGYFGSVEVSVKDQIVHGKVLGLYDSITYESDDIKNIQKVFEEAVDEYLDDCKMLNRNPNKIPSGKFSLRIPAMLHKALEIEKELTGASINQITENSLWEHYSENIFDSSEWKFEKLNNKVLVGKKQLEKIFPTKENSITHFSVGRIDEKKYSSIDC